MLHVALYQPQIPPNTGNIARQCVGMNAALHLIGPVAFRMNDHDLKRAGLDYWPHLRLTQHASPDAFLEWLAGHARGVAGDAERGMADDALIAQRLWLVENHGTLRYDRAAYCDHDVLVLGRETTGLPREWLDRWPARVVHVPVMGSVRSYNLANTAAIVLAQATADAGLYPG